ncbi:unnamed protein product [Citrullus colocynthis]|uniref:Uncharacterized protein n=1 Tax=Citrullus colocynthis TaxID=252529 RepID=A0ABP0XN56_9ROSI
MNAANGLEGFLNGIVPVPPKCLDTSNMQLNLEFSTWESSSEIRLLSPTPSAPLGFSSLSSPDLVTSFAPSLPSSNPILSPALSSPSFASALPTLTFTHHSDAQDIEAPVLKPEQTSTSPSFVSSPNTVILPMSTTIAS